MTGPPIIELPRVFRQEVHEVPGGLGGAGQALQGIAQILQARQQQMQQLAIKRGELALEQDKFDAENKQRNLANKQRQTAIDTLNHIMSGGQLPPPAMPGQLGGTGGSQAGGAGAPAPQQGQQPPAVGGAPQQGGLGDVAGAFPQIAEELAKFQRQQAIGPAFQAILSRYDGKALRNDPTTRMQAVTQLMGIDPVTAEAWEKANPPRQVIVKSTGNAVLRFDGQTGEYLGMAVGTGKLTALQQKFQMFGPQYKQAIDNMTTIEKHDPSAVATVSSALIGSGIKFASIGDFTSAIAKAGFSGNSAKYAMFLKNAVEGSIGMQPMGRSGKDFMDLIQNVLIPGPSEVSNQFGEMDARQRMRNARLDGYQQSLQNQMFAPLGGAPGAADTDSLDSLESAAGRLGIPRP